jgi:hypothetical protein
MFIDLARGSKCLKVWRSVLPLLLCFQQLLRSGSIYVLTGANVVRIVDEFVVTIVSDKNHRSLFEARFPIDPSRPYCVGLFLRDFIRLFGIVLGDAGSFFACAYRTDKVLGLQVPMPTVSVKPSTMHNGFKFVIGLAGLDPARFLSHSAKRGGATAAVSAGATDIQTQQLGRWKSDRMASYYVRQAEQERAKVVDSFRT